jgi:hypothetical protein
MRRAARCFAAMIGAKKPCVDGRRPCFPVGERSRVDHDLFHGDVNRHGFLFRAKRKAASSASGKLACVEMNEPFCGLGIVYDYGSPTRCSGWTTIRASHYKSYRSD